MALDGTPLVAKILLYLAAKRVTVICEDGQREQFTGPANYFKAEEVAQKSAGPNAIRQDLELDTDSGFGTTLIVPPAVQVERFD